MYESPKIFVRWNSNMNFNDVMKIKCFMLLLCSISADAAPDISVLQCRAKCIDKFEITLLKKTSRYKAVSCLSKECTKCSRLCRTLSVSPNGNCKSICSSEDSQSLCESTCLFLKEKRKLGSKPGSCPKVITSFDLTLVSGCQKDSECPESEKCCPNQNLKTCHQPEFTFDARYPPVPVDIKAFPRTPSLALLIWRMPFNMTWTGGIIFVIEKRRSMRLLRPSNADFSSWSFAGETSDLRTTIPNLNPGDWYQFRIIAHSKDGANGFSQHSSSVVMSSEIRRPSRPRNFTAVETWVEDGQVFVNLTWRSPLMHDLPIDRYRLIYSQYVEGSGQHYDAVHERRQKVHGDRKYAVITSLQPGLVYVVKIQAILTLRRKRIRGRWKRIYLKTPSLKKLTAVNTSAVTTIQPTPTAAPTVKLVTLKLVTVKADIRFYCGVIERNSNGYIWATLHWKVPGKVQGVQISYRPLQCKNGEHILSVTKKTAVTSGKKEITLTDLYPFCLYTAKMIPYSNGKAKKEKIISFSTAINSSKPTQPSVLLNSHNFKVPSSATAIRLYSSYSIFLIAIFNLVYLVL